MPVSSDSSSVTVDFGDVPLTPSGRFAKRKHRDATPYPLEYSKSPDAPYFMTVQTPISKKARHGKVVRFAFYLIGVIVVLGLCGVIAVLAAPVDHSSSAVSAADDANLVASVKPVTAPLRRRSLLYFHPKAYNSMSWSATKAYLNWMIAVQFDDRAKAAQGEALVGSAQNPILSRRDDRFDRVREEHDDYECYGMKKNADAEPEWYCPDDSEEVAEDDDQMMTIQPVEPVPAKEQQRRVTFADVHDYNQQALDEYTRKLDADKDHPQMAAERQEMIDRYWMYLQENQQGSHEDPYFDE